MNDNPVWQAATLILPMVLAIVCHEVAHGLVARMLGDHTAQERGRLTLNPLPHVDPIGTVILPGLLALAHLPVFGWAKPVPIDARRLRHPRSGMMLVAAAGPAMNLALAALAAVLLGAVSALAPEHPDPWSLVAFTADNLQNFIAVNLFLALFNLLPVPPFDGSHIVEGALPRRAAIAYAQLRRFALPLALLLIVILPRIAPGFSLIDRWVLPPFTWAMGAAITLADMTARLVGG
jgi:Zn-dependent protease